MLSVMASRTTSTVSTSTDQMLTSKQNNDIPSWLSVLIVVSVSASVQLSIVLFSSNYLTSETGFADGGDMYSHIIEALYIKEQFQQGKTDLWYSGVTLGYPILMAYQPLPCLVSAATMMAAERYMSPLRAFRWLLVGILISMPWSWFYSCQSLGMSRLESSMVTICLFSLRSWVDFGLELSAFHVYGLYAQVYGMFMLPLAVSSSYKYILYTEGSQDVASVIVALNLLCHSIFGIYVIVFTITMLTSVTLVQVFLERRINGLIAIYTRALEIHGISWVISAWWLFPTLSYYQYIGGVPWKYDVTNPLPFDLVLRKFLAGEMYDFQRGVPYTTLATLVGIFCICVGHQSMYFMHHFGEKNFPKSNDKLHTSHLEEKSIVKPLLGALHHSEKNNVVRRRQVFHTWLMLSFTACFVLFLGRGTLGLVYELIPFHAEMESLRYINTLHFLGLLLFGIGTSFVLANTCRLLSQVSGITVNHLVVLVMLVGAPIYLSNQSQRIVNHLSVSEINNQLANRIQLLRGHPIIGRLYGNKEFDTAGPWELSVLPYLTGKPGVHSYSRGYHDSLTVYYLESFQPNLSTTPWFPDLLRLFNIRYIIAKTIPLDFIEGSKLLTLLKIDKDITVYIRSSREMYGYFEFVSVPGTIQGDLKGIRDTVVSMTQIFQVRALLAINSLSYENETAKVAVTPMTTPISFYQPLSRLLHYFGRPERYLTTWTLNGRNVSEHDFLDGLMGMYLVRPIKSVILKESIRPNLYKAIVKVPDEAFSKDIYSTEHLLLKVTYHPYWSCKYAPPTEISSNTEEYTTEEYDKWTEAEVHHVIPNLMSITLPPGRHEVICFYSNPLYQKLGFLLFIFIISLIIVKEIIQKVQELSIN